MTWRYGDIVTLRWRRKQPLDVALPVRIVEDGADRNILYTAIGTPMKAEATAAGRVMTRDVAPWLERQSLTAGYVDWPWTDNHSLAIQRHGSLVSVWLLFRADWSLNAYYVNLQAPLQRTAVGFDTADYMLDLVVQPDLTWQWKDRDEFAACRDHALLPAALLDEVQAAAEAMIPVIEGRGFPFDAGYEAWRPDPAWTVPALPADWADGLDLRGFTLF